jgi:hypothetical protein
MLKEDTYIGFTEKRLSLGKKGRVKKIKLRKG